MKAPSRIPTRRLLLDEFRRRPINFDRSRRAEYTPENGWHVDDFCQTLVSEPPGPPLVDGPFAAAKRLMRGYEFADSSIVRAFYDPDEPLDGRTMVLELRFHRLLRFYSGVRVTGVHDEHVQINGREVYAWGWDYSTLQGHLEMGQMDWRVWKWADTGELQFRIHAFSRPAPDPNLIIRAGFRLFGRHEQLSFLRSTLQRMARLTNAAADKGRQALRQTSIEHTAGRLPGADEQIHDNLVEHARGTPAE